MNISVVIPLFNKKDTVYRAINSVLQQTKLPIEIIIINDGSTDGSEVLVESFMNPLVKIIHQKNKGVSAARNRGIYEAIGDWIAFLDADDEWKNEYIEQSILLNTKFPTCKIISSAYMYGLPNGKYQQIVLNNLKFKKSHGIIDNYFQIASSSSPPLWTSAIIVKKDKLIEIKGFPVGVKLGEDLLTWARLVIHEKIAYSKHPLSIFWHDNIKFEQMRYPEVPDKVGEVLKKMKNENKEIKGLSNYISHWYKMRSHIYIENKDYYLALIEIFKSLRYNPLNFKVMLFIVYILAPTFIKTKMNEKFKEVERNVYININ